MKTTTDKAAAALLSIGKGPAQYHKGLDMDCDPVNLPGADEDAIPLSLSLAPDKKEPGKKQPPKNDDKDDAKDDSEDQQNAEQDDSGKQEQQDEEQEQEQEQNESEDQSEDEDDKPNDNGTGPNDAALWHAYACALATGGKLNPEAIPTHADALLASYKARFPRRLTNPNP